jgi:hypothetical protein
MAGGSGGHRFPLMPALARGWRQLYAKAAPRQCVIAHRGRAKAIDRGVWVARNNSANKMGKFNSGFPAHLIRMSP